MMLIYLTLKSGIYWKDVIKKIVKEEDIPDCDRLSLAVFHDPSFLILSISS